MRLINIKHFIFTLALISGVLAVSACSNPDVGGEAKYPTGADRTTTGGDIYAERESIFGKGGFNVFGGKDEKKNDGSTGIGVNAYLWRASLDTVSFMPLASADPFGGVILTDWYSPPENPDERFKLNVFILDRQLRADGVQVKVFRQARKGGEWRDVASADDTARKLEDTILTRARQMRVSQMSK